RRFVRMQALTGYALMAGRAAVGYVYSVCEDRKGLIGDLYVMRRHASPQNELYLLEAALRSMRTSPRASRVESQLMMLHDETRHSLPLSKHAHAFRRNFMMADMQADAVLPPGKGA